MKMNMILTAGLIAAFSQTSTMAAKIGDTAAPLTIKNWVKGKAVDVKDGKNIYVVEFWATWCPPCRVSIPHLTEMQKRFKDKGVVMVSVSDEPLATVKPFVDKMAGTMNYTVACDDNHKTSDGYMKAFAIDGIPHAFIVSKEGKVIWHGHPMDNLDKTLEEIVSGKFDLETAKKKDAYRAALDDYQKLSIAGSAKAKELGKILLADCEDDIDQLCQFAFQIVADNDNKNRDFVLADEALTKAEKQAGGKNHQVIGVRAIARLESGKPDDGIALVKEAIELSKDDQDKDRYRNYLKVMEVRNKQPVKEATKDRKDAI